MTCSNLLYVQSLCGTFMTGFPANAPQSGRNCAPPVCSSPRTLWFKLVLAGLWLLVAGAGNFPAVAQQQSAGTVWAWGYNYYGQLGNGTTNTSLPYDVTTPGQVGNLTGVVAVAGGAYHTLALKSDGTVWAWGFNGDGELGNGTTTNTTTPVQVRDPNDPSGNLTGVVAIAAGFYTSFALKSDGTLWGWGLNRYGEVGNGTTNITSPYGIYTPVQVINLTGVVAVASGGNHSFALKSDGTVWAWGSGGYGQLGNGNDDPGTGNATNRPIQVVDPSDPTGYLTGVAAIASGADHSLALKSDGTVWAWGDNQYGQLGNGSTTPLDGSAPPGIATPGQVSNLTGIVAISGGGDHCLALKSDGTVWAWGHNIFGELGDGETNPNPPYGVDIPLQVLAPSGYGSNLTGVVAIAAGGDFSLALKSDGTVWAWGDNEYGELGNGTTNIAPPPYGSYTPVQVVNPSDPTSHLTGVMAIAGGAYHSLALTPTLGTGQAAVPNVVGDTQTVASAAIVTAGLTVGTIIQQSSSTVPSGNVISESPVALTLVNTGSSVSLVVSSGATQVAVPNVVGDTQTAASAAIVTAGLTVGTVTQQSSSTVPSGNVISESPVAGTLVNTGSSVSLVVSSGQGGGGGPTVAFIGSDTHTQGTWQTPNGRIYGTDGYSVEGDSSQLLPGYITQFAAQSATAYTWVPSTTDPRAPLNGNDSSRVAACLYGGSFTLDINFTQGSHLFAIYALDWDSTARSETITILDPNNNNTVLNTETVSNFHGGTYLVWNISGQVAVQVTLNSGANAVVSGVFFGVAETVSVTPPSANLTAGQQQQFTAAFTGTPGVAWSLLPPGSASGQINSSGQYTAPATITQLTTVTVQATTQDGTVSGDATVTLTPTSSQVSVPNVVGDTQAAATAAITNAGLTLGTVTSQASSTVPSGNVISETPSAGTSVNTGSPVNLVLSSGGGGSGPTVSFVKADTSAQGNWRGTYGTDGYYVINGLPSNIPAYATFNVDNATPYTWAASTSNVRALETGSGPTGPRIAATWYNYTTFAFDLTISGAHTFALYAVDWDYNGRAETVTIVDPNNNNAVLDTEHLTNSNLVNGEYLVWNISGQVKIIVTLNSGANAVVSGVFFGGGSGGGSESVTVKPQQVTLAANQQQKFTAAVTGTSNQNVTWSVSSGPGAIDSSSGLYTAPATFTAGTHVTLQATSQDGTASGTATVTLSVTAGVSFIASDTSTRGNWQGTYGTGGEMIVNGPQNSPIGSYGTFNSVQNASQFVWVANTSDTRALETGNGPAGTRTAATWFGSIFDFDVTFNGPQQFEVYALDWDSGGRVETITIVDPSSNAVLDTETISNFSQGTYLVWNISGHVKIIITLNNGANAVISGAFFD